MHEGYEELFILARGANAHALKQKNTLQHMRVGRS